MSSIQHVHVHKFIAHQRNIRGLSARTCARRAWSLNLWAGHCGGDLAAATSDDVEDFLSQYQGAATRYALRSDLNQLYRFLLRRGLVDRNPVEQVESAKVRKRGASPVPAADVLRLIAATSGATRLAIMLAAYAGLRVSEIAALCGEDVDLDARMLMVRNGKGGKDASVPLAPALAAELAWWPRSGRLFRARNGQSIGSRIRTAYRRLGIEARPHDLRHSFGTEAARVAGGDLRKVQGLMRHESISTTQRYVDYWPNGQDVIDGLYGGDAA